MSQPKDFNGAALKSVICFKLNNNLAVLSAKCTKNASRRTVTKKIYDGSATRKIIYCLTLSTYLILDRLSS